uniref:Reverse transcriptase domain-containing protein n=1 Tax=Schistocephalus solidus TaxID=70667 RepID=A0A183SEH5_SCHSO
LLTWVKVNERMAYGRLKGHYKNISFVSVYASTSAAEQHGKETFYSQLQALVERLPCRDLLIVAGDWKGRTGRDDSTNSHLIGRVGLGSRCENGERLLNFAGQNRLFITNTGFQHRNKHLLTWYSNDGHTASQIDYILAIPIKDERKPEAYDHHCLRTILQVKYTDFVSNETVRNCCENIARISKAVQERGLRWFGHVLRRPPYELSVTALEPTPLPNWRRRRGGQFKTWLETVRQDMEVVLGPSVFGVRRWRRKWIELSRSAAADPYALSCDPPSEGEVAEAIQRLHNNKAPGEDGILAEIYTACVDTLAPCPHESVRDSRTRPNQAGFRAGPGCVKQIFTVRRILELHHGHQQPTIMCFIDFAAAFDFVHRECLWRIMELDGVPVKIIALIKAYYRSITISPKPSISDQVFNKVTFCRPVYSSTPLTGSSRRPYTVLTVWNMHSDAA